MLEIRKVMTVAEETFVEGGKAAEPPLVLAASIAVIHNPWAGRGFVENLRPEIGAYAPKLADLLVGALFKVVGSAARVEAYGKAAVVGVDGEVEHASAIIHTLRFGNIFRSAVEGTSFLSFTNTRGGPGATITIPMVHKTDDARRSHFLTFATHVPDAPRADEIVVALGAATGGRPHARIGDRRLDMQELGLS